MALDRLRSFRLSRQAAPVHEPVVTGVVDLGSDELLPPLEPEYQSDKERSEAAAEPELSRLPARLRKSASDESAFVHFMDEEDSEVVEAQSSQPMGANAFTPPKVGQHTRVRPPISPPSRPSRLPAQSPSKSRYDLLPPLTPGTQQRRLKGVIRRRRPEC